MCRIISDAASALSITFTFLVMCATLAKTLSLKRVANRAGIKGNLVTLLIRDGTLYLSLTIILDILETVLFNVESRVAGIVVILGPVSWLRPIIVSRMILDLKSIDRISTSSLPEQHTSRFSSIMFVGNIGAPLNMTPINEIVEDEPEETEISGATITPVTLKQLSEDPLSIGLFDEQYERSSLQIAATDNAVLEQ
ncbi:hypothetical protein C8Q75DRAFT_533511 [Abortiporus biennis]|nr:hypothetical protein C8Q75DRAFT_533511 [Abortiporus biennis]